MRRSKCPFCRVFLNPGISSELLVASPSSSISALGSHPQHFSLRGSLPPPPFGLRETSPKRFARR
jgi:hypothetical protein